MDKKKIIKQIREDLFYLLPSLSQAHSEFCFDFENDSAEIYDEKYNEKYSVFPDDKVKFDRILDNLSKLEAD